MTDETEPTPCFTDDCTEVATTTRPIPLLGRWWDFDVCQACAEKLDNHYEAQDQQNVAALLREGA